MLTKIAVNRLVSKCRAVPLVATVTTRLQQVRPLTQVAWSKRDEALANWESLKQAPQEWYDNRRRKTNPKAPDFVRRDDRNAAIWVDSRDTPEWADEILSELDARGNERQASRSSEGRGGDRLQADLEKWASLQNNPEEWYDNRDRKTNPRAPDFKRRDDKTVALWLDSDTTPEWVNEVLQMLDERKQQRQAERRAASPEEYREQRYQQADSHMAYEQGQQRRAQSPDGTARRDEELAKWEHLRENVGAWFDNRRTKTNPRAPDFRNKDDRSVVLWLDSYNKPDWVDEFMAEVDANPAPRYGQSQEQEQYRQPRRQADPEVVEQKRVAEAALWESLRDHPELWYDNRNRKMNPRAPDFKRKDDKNVVLWISSYGAPPYLDELLQHLDVRSAERAAMAGAPPAEQGAVAAGY